MITFVNVLIHTTKKNCRQIMSFHCDGVAKFYHSKNKTFLTAVRFYRVYVISSNPTTILHEIFFYFTTFIFDWLETLHLTEEPALTQMKWLILKCVVLYLMNIHLKCKYFVYCIARSSNALKRDISKTNMTFIWRCY